MAKDPAFLFYYQDFLVGTTFMTMEERGAYITLLCYQADKGKITEQEILKIISEPIWRAICCKFKFEDGFYFNVRLSKEVEKRRSFTDSRRKNLHMDTHMESHMEAKTTHHMENEIENKNKDVIKDKKKENDFVLPSWIPRETWEAYLEVRNKKRAAKTTYALNLIIKKLEKIRLENKDYPVAVLNQSITGGWTDVYPLKENIQKPKPKPTKQDSPYEKCPRCGKELRKGYEYINIGGQKCCEYCPEAREQAKKDYEKLGGLVAGIGKGINA